MLDLADDLAKDVWFVHTISQVWSGNGLEATDVYRKDEK